MTGRRCIPVITTGRCGSSLLMQLLADFGFHSPPGGTDGRHPCGFHDEWSLIHPQHKDNWNAFKAEVEKRNKDRTRWAMKVVRGILHWGPAAVFELLPDPRPVFLFREDEKVLKTHSPTLSKMWYPKIRECMQDVECLYLSFERLVDDPQFFVPQLYSYVCGGLPPDDLSRSIQRVQVRRHRRHKESK